MGLIYEIRHRLEYEYSEPVYLEAQTLFLRPRSDGNQKLLDYRLGLTPEPYLLSEKIDPFGNHPVRAWFQGQVKKFQVSAFSRVSLDLFNPFNYLLDENCLRLPVSYEPAFAEGLSIYLKPAVTDPAVRAFSKKIADRVGGSTGDFLFSLCSEISGGFEKLRREEGSAWTPARTLSERKGACRDLALLFIEACRVQGIAARFTSGYFNSEDNDSGEIDLHAWAEVYLQGAGWKGYDPTAGIAAAERHIAVASAHENYSLAPVQGTFRGSARLTRFETSVNLTLSRSAGISGTIPRQ